MSTVTSGTPDDLCQEGKAFEDVHTKIGIHIGFHKTGSTFLQEEFFSKLPGVNFIGNASEKFCGELRHLIYDSPALWDGGTSLCGKVKDDCQNIISHEDLSGGGLWVGGGGLAIDFRTACRLKKVFPEAKVLMIIREQFSMLRSLYWQYVWERGVLSFNAFLQRTLNDTSFLSYQHLCYDQYIDFYRQLFGDNNVLVLPYEKMAQDITMFLADISRFFGLREFRPEYTIHNPSRKGAMSFLYLRLLNLFLPWEVTYMNRGREIKKIFRMLLPLMRVFPMKEQFKMKAEIEKKLSDTFRISNRTTEQYLNISLEELGYLV